MRTWIKNPLAVFAEDAAGGIVVEDNQIVECLANGSAPKSPCDREFDASEHVILPGLINAHHHFFQTLTRAYGPALNKELFAWLTTLYPVWSRLTAEQLADATELALTELLLSGCTTASDHHYMFPEGLENGIDIQAEVSEKVGIRVTLTRGSMDLSVNDGGLAPESTVQETDVILADSERVIGKYHDSSEGAMQQIALAPCSPFGVTRELMIESVRLADEFGVTLHTHLAETEDENNFCLREYGCRPVDYLEGVGWMKDNVWLAHGIHFNQDEIKRLGSANVGISHCPGSNMLLASGICPTQELLESGARIGIGVDGSASEDASNMIQEARLALQIQRLRYGSKKITHLDVIEWATKGSAACLGRDDIGSIACGKQADLAMYKLDELRFSGAGNPLAALILCGAHRADRVMVAGVWRVLDGEIPNIDLNELMARHQASSRKLIQMH